MRIRNTRHSRGKEVKLELAREENKNLTEDVRKLKREVEIWKGRLKTGRRLGKFNKEMKPLDEEAKVLEPKYKELRTKSQMNSKEISHNQKCIDSMINIIKNTLSTAKISYTEENFTNGDTATKFLKHLSSKDKSTLRKVLKTVE